MNLFGRRRIADLEAREQRLLARVKELESELSAAKHLGRTQLAQADAAHRRLHDRNQRLVVVLDQARAAQGNEEYDQLHTRLERTLRACARYRQQLATARRDQATTQQQLDSRPAPASTTPAAYELATLRRQLRVTQAQLDNALGLRSAIYPFTPDRENSR